MLALKYRLANGLLVFEKTDLPRIFTGGQRTIKDSLAQLVKTYLAKVRAKKWPEKATPRSSRYSCTHCMLYSSNERDYQ